MEALVTGGNKVRMQGPPRRTAPLPPSSRPQKVSAYTICPLLWRTGCFNACRGGSDGQWGRRGSVGRRCISVTGWHALQLGTDAPMPTTVGTLPLPLNSRWSYLQSIRKTISSMSMCFDAPEEWLPRGSLAPMLINNGRLGEQCRCVCVCLSAVNGHL